MPTSYQFTPRIPSAPHPTPGSDYKLPHVKSTRPPVQNPYDKFTQPEFDAWIGGITSALKRALGQAEEEEHAKPDKHDPTNFVHTQPNVFDDASELSDDHIEDSFAEVKARRAAGKGKARDPREGPGFGKGDSSNPIDLVSSDEEDAEEVELTIAGDYVPESDDEKDVGALSEGEYSWERGQASSPLAPSPAPKISDFKRDHREEEEYGSEEYEDEEKPYGEEAQYEEYDDDEYYNEDDGDEDHPQVSHTEVIDLSSDDDEIEDDISESEQPPRKIRKVSPQRRVDEESEPDGEGELDEDSEGEQPRREASWAGSSRRVQGERERPPSPEVIDLDSGEEGQSDEGEVPEYENVSSYQEVTKVSSTRHDDQQGDDEEFFDEEDDLGEGDGEEYDGEREEKGGDDDVGASQIPLSHDRTSSVRSQHDGHEHSEVANDDDDEIQEIQPMEDDTSFPPKRSVSPFESNMPEIPDPWSGPRTYAEDYYSGGDVQIPLSETVDAHHLGPNDDDLTADLGDDIVQPTDENTAFPPSSEDVQTSVDISDPWKGPQLYAEDFYSGGPVQQHGGLATAHYLGPTDIDSVNDLIHNVITQEKEEKEDEEMQPQGADTSFPQGDEETGGFVDIADPWIGPQTYAEDYYSGGDVRTLPGAPIDPALLSGTGDVEDDIDNFLTPGALTPSQTNATNDIDGEGDEENEIIAPSTERHVPSPLTRRNMPIPEDADIIAIEDSDEEQEQEHSVMLDELEGEDDEDDDISLKYPDFDEAHQPLDIGEEDELDISAGIVPPLQVNAEEEPDVHAMNREFEEGEEWFDLEQPSDANISVTLGHVEEQEEGAESRPAEESKGQDLSEIVLSDEPQDKSISINDKPEATTEPSSQTVESDFLAMPHAEEQFLVTTATDSDTQITFSPDTILTKDQEGPADDLERDVEMQSTLQDRNTAMEESLAEDSSMMDVEPVIDDNSAVETTVSTEQEVSANPAVSIGQELDEESIQSIPGVHDTGPQDLHISSTLPISSTPLPASPPGQLPTPPSEKNRHVSLPPESNDEATVKSPPTGHTMETEQATGTADNIHLSNYEPSHVTGNVDIIEHTVIEATEYDIQKDADGEFDDVGGDIDVRSAFTGEDVDDVLFSVEEPMTEGRLTEEPPERQMSLGVVSLPSEEIPTVDHDEDMGASQALSNNAPMDLEVSAPSLSQVSQEGVEMESTMETINHPDIESTSKVLQDEGEVVVPVAADPTVLDSINQPITSTLLTNKPTDSLSSEAMETQVTSPAAVPNVPDALLEVDEPSPSLGPHVQAADEDSKTPIEHAQSATNLAHPLESDQSSSIANTTPTVDVFGMLPPASNIESRTGADGQEMGATSLPYRAPSSSARVILTRKPTDPVLMADPYPYCLSTPNLSSYTQRVNHPGEPSIGTLLSSSVQSDSGATSSQIDLGVMMDEAGQDDSLFSQKSNLGSQNEILAATTEEESVGEGASQPTRKRKRTTASAKSRQVPTTVETSDGTSPPVAESAQKGPAKELKKRAKERKSSSLNKSASGSWKKKSTGNIPETTSHETILVNPRLEGKAGEASQRAPSVTSTQEESPANSNAAVYRKLFPPGNASAVVSPAPSHRSFTSQPSPTINKPNILPHPNAASESLLHAHGQKRKAMLSQAVQQSVSPRVQTKMPQLSRFPSAPMIVSSQPSASTSVIPAIETAKLPKVPPASSVSPTDVLSTTVPVKPVTPIPKANSMSARPPNRSTPVTRSHCRYHRISLPKEEGGPRVSFLVPGCSLNDKELMDEEEIVDHGDATVDDSRNMLKDIESLGFSLDLIGVLRQLVGLDILREQEIFYLPQPGELVTRRIPLQKAASTIRAPGDNSSYAGSPGGYSGSIMASPRPNRPPHSASSWSESPSLSSLLRQPPVIAGSDQAETDKGYASTERDLDTEFDSSDDEDGKHAKPSPSDPTTSKSKGKQARKFKGHKGIDLTYEPDKDHEDEESDTPTSTRKRRKSVRGTKRNRDSDAVPMGNDGHEREAKKPKTEMDTPLEPATPAQPQNPTI